MSFELVAPNAVIVAHQFNPSVIGQLWLVRNGLLEEDDFRPGCVFTDMVVQVNSREFDLMVVPQQCQFSPRVDQQREQELAIDKVGSIVHSLPHTPFRAIGLNFTWHLSPEDNDASSISRALFFRESGPLHREFDVPDARFGGYMSKDAFGGRLKLDVKPITVKKEDEELEKIQFVFNLHRDVADEEDPVGCIEHVLHQWNEVRDESSRIVHAIMRKEPA